MTLTLSLVQRSYDLTVEVNGVSLVTTLLASSHRHPAAEISDATALGRAVLTAPDAAAARAILGSSGGGGLTDGDHGGVIVSAGGTVLALDYAEINATVQPAWGLISGRPTTLSGFGVTDGITAAAVAAAYQPLRAVLTATTASYTTAEQAKLAAIAAGATANASDAALRDRATHTGTQAAATITGLARVATSGSYADLAGRPSVVPYLIPASGEVILASTGTNSGTLGTIAGAAGRMDLFPFSPRLDTTITGLSLNVTTLVASALAKIVIYDSDANGRPNALLFEGGDLDCSTTGVKTSALSMLLRQDKTYWLGVRHSSTATISQQSASATADLAGGTPVTALRKTVRRTLAYATAAPGTWGWTSSEINAAAAPAIWLQVA